VLGRTLSRCYAHQLKMRAEVIVWIDQLGCKNFCANFNRIRGSRQGRGLHTGPRANRSGTALTQPRRESDENSPLLTGPVFRKTQLAFFLEPSIPYTSEALKKENVNKIFGRRIAGQAVFTIQLPNLNRMSVLEDPWPGKPTTPSVLVPSLQLPKLSRGDFR